MLGWSAALRPPKNLTQTHPQDPEGWGGKKLLRRGAAHVGALATRLARMRMAVPIVPNYGRCVFEVSHQYADGFFLGSQNAERDAVAIMSRPVLVNRWVWVSHKESPDKPAVTGGRTPTAVGVLLNTNPHLWLKDRNYNITGTPTTGVSLVAMLDAGRFEVALVPELVFQYAVQQSNRSLANYRVTLHSNQPFGIYLFDHAGRVSVTARPVAHGGLDVNALAVAGSGIDIHGVKQGGCFGPGNAGCLFANVADATLFPRRQNTIEQVAAILEMPIETALGDF
jgi:hypothetical protein